MGMCLKTSSNDKSFQLKTDSADLHLRLAKMFKNEIEAKKCKLLFIIWLFIFSWIVADFFHSLICVLKSAMYTSINTDV